MTNANGAAAALQGMIYTTPNLPGVQLADGTDITSLRIGCIAREKEGKSTLPVTCFGWPTPQHQPLVLAWDETGPNSCLRLGYAVHKIVVRDAPADNWFSKGEHVVNTILDNLAAYKAAYGVIFIDCVSTQVERYLEAAGKIPKGAPGYNPDPRSHYFAAQRALMKFMNALEDTGIPTVWLAWLAEAETEETKQGNQKIKRTIPGGFDVAGKKMRNMIGGKMHHTFILEKQKHGEGAQGADMDGYVRLLHTRDWANIRAGGRFAHKLLEPEPAHFGHVLKKMTGRG